MIKSMTGFGRCEQADENRKIVVEMKAVNHRYCDINVKLPKKLSFFESAVRSLMKKYIQRGKVDVYITYEDYTEHNVCLKYNKELAREYLEHLKAMTAQFGIADDVTVTSLARYPEVLLWKNRVWTRKNYGSFLRKRFSSACERFVQTRIDEGCRFERGPAVKAGQYAGKGGVY